MAANISCEYDQNFRPAVFRVTCKFQDMQNLIHPARRATINILAEYQRIFEAWASNARLLYGSNNRFYEVQRKMERLEATLSNGKSVVYTTSQVHTNWRQKSLD